MIPDVADEEHRQHGVDAEGKHIQGAGKEND
jgi:hypothetical protein